MLVAMLFPLYNSILGVVGVILAFRMRSGRWLVIGAMTLFILQNLTTHVLNAVEPAILEAGRYNQADTLDLAHVIIQPLLYIAMWVLILTALLRCGSKARAQRSE
ncbi:hypothetical protein FHX37_3692 [Haloactinospora alba]|uniref:Uncharacterized protein n=1 Tax=Haloactinospora alba TaxID=405555 RepID=A0A543N946_9ACTN|nr:hypothetical protein [Haloactinospora alba]TQN28355.1 hypothetical protein FHX37_3692 [Haloactinospora alba]